MAQAQTQDDFVRKLEKIELKSKDFLNTKLLKFKGWRTGMIYKIKKIFTLL